MWVLTLLLPTSLQDGWTALHSAVANGHLANARALLEHGRTPLNPDIQCQVTILPQSRYPNPIPAQYYL